MFYSQSLLTLISQTGEERLGKLGQMGEWGFTASSLIPRSAYLTCKLPPLKENEQMTADTPNSAQLESTAKFQCHLPSVNQQLTPYSSQNTFYLLIHCPILDSFPIE